MADPSTANKTNDIARHTPLRPYDRSRCDEHGGSCKCTFRGVPAPLGMGMIAPQTLLRNAEGAQSEGPEPSSLDSSDPMIEAGASSTTGSLRDSQPVLFHGAAPWCCTRAPGNHVAQPGKVKAAQSAMGRTSAARGTV
jgi:hypothetical protein